MELLGEGRIGRVYRARDLLESRDVALKMPHDWHTRNPEFRARFRRELLTGMRLRHAGIVRSLETGEHDGTPFLVSELIEGTPILQWFYGTNRDYEALAEVLEQLLDALEYAHSRRVVHQELKPANILVDKDGAPKMLDFGLAGRLEDQLRIGPHPESGLAYLSPEQAMGERGDQRSDLYALGAVLFHLLAERPLMRAEEPADFLLSHLNETPPPLSALRGDVPVWLERLVARLLLRRPEQRPQSANEVLHWVRRRRQADNTAQQRQAPILGRAAEREKLQEALNGLEEGRGQMVRISGAAGSGKTLLVDDLLQRANERDFLTVRIESTADSVMHLGSIAAHFEDPDLPLFERILESAMAMPLVLVLEGIHRAHDSVAELLGELMALVEDAPLLVVVTDRPDELENETLKAQLEAFEERIKLDGLDWEACAQLIEERTWSPPPRAATAWFMKVTKGNPLFVKLLAEHLEGTHLQQTVPGESQWTTPAKGSYPDTLEGLLGRKLERQGPDARAVLGLGACLGERFSFNALKAVTYHEEHELESLLEQVVREGLLKEEWSSGLVRYSFNNSLLWNLACESIHERRRRRLHLLAARFYEKSGIWPASILAYHYRQADRWEKSLRYTAEALEDALENKDRGEATYHYTRLLEGLRTLPTRWPGPDLERFKRNQLPRANRLDTLVSWTLLVTGEIDMAAERVIHEKDIEQALMKAELYLWGKLGVLEAEKALEAVRPQLSKEADQRRFEEARQALLAKDGRQV